MHCKEWRTLQDGMDPANVFAWKAATPHRTTADGNHILEGPFNCAQYVTIHVHVIKGAR